MTRFPVLMTSLLQLIIFAEDCTDPGAPVDGGQVGSPSYQAYTTVSFACDAGYSLVGASITTCMAGVYSPAEVPSCIGMLSGVSNKTTIQNKEQDSY